MSLVAFLLNVQGAPKLEPKRAPKTLQQASDARIRRFMKRRGSVSIPDMASALGYTQGGLRVVTKSLRRRGKIDVSEYIRTGPKGIKTALWKWIGD